MAHKCKTILILNGVPHARSGGPPACNLTLGFKPFTLESRMDKRHLLPIALLVGGLGLSSAFTASAQNTGPGDRSVTTTTTDGFDWGLLGLLGLAGLVGLKRKDDYNHTNTRSTTATR